MRKWTYLALLFVALIVGKESFAQDRQIIDKVIGKVGNELILLSDVEDQFDLMRQQRGTLEDAFRCNIMENLLAQNLLLNQARLDSVIVADEEVQAQLDARIERILAYMNNDVKQFEDYYGQTVSEVKEQFREDLKNKLLIERMRAQILEGITVTPSEVKTFFKSIPKDSLPYFNSEVEVGEIVYKPKVNDEQKGIAMDLLTDIRKRVIEDGEPFEELAKKYSMDPGSGQFGGDLRWQRRGTFVPEFEAAAYNLENGEYSGVVETEFGFHLIQLLERRGNSIHTRHILIKPEITSNDLEKASFLLDSIRQLIMADSLNFSAAVKRYSDENQQSFNNDGTMVNPQTGNSFFEIGDLDPDVYFTLDTMTVGEISAPFEFRQPTGEIFYRIVNLKSRTSPHKANLRQDYSKIKQASLESKKSTYISDWVQQKINETYITIDASYTGCPNLQVWNQMVNRP
ncbi:MAG: peptidylprolyl isomerase [Bacteroidota bacterium]